MKNRYERIAIEIADLNRAFHKIKLTKRGEREFTSVQEECIYFLYKSGEISFKKLCELTKEDKAAVSRAVAYLSKNQYARTRSDEVGNGMLVALTQKGEQVAISIGESMAEKLEILRQGLTNEELDIALKCLIRANSNLQEYAKNYKKSYKKDK